MKLPRSVVEVQIRRRSHLLLRSALITVKSILMSKVFLVPTRRIDDAKLLDQIGFGTLETLARGGAKVLHADAVAWARRAGIAFGLERQAVKRQER